MQVHAFRQTAAAARERVRLAVHDTRPFALPVQIVLTPLDILVFEKKKGISLGSGVWGPAEFFELSNDSTSPERPCERRNAPGRRGFFVAQTKRQA